MPLHRLTLLVLTLTLFGGLAAAPAAPAAISGKRAKTFATVIAELGPRVAGSAVEREAGSLVATQLQELGYRVRRQAVPLPNGGRSLNVVARSPGPLRVIVVAHLDGVSGTDAANDNASGVAVMVELARALRGERGLL
ncbi:MAG: M28 family peptidase, partial [Gaiellaceae bacterium]